MQLPPTVLSSDKRNTPMVPNAKMPVISEKESEREMQSKDDDGTSMKPPVNSTSSGSELSDDEGDSGVSVAEATQARGSLRHRSGIKPPRTLETTLFERLEKMYGSKIKRMLNVQYR